MPLNSKKLVGILVWPCPSVRLRITLLGASETREWLMQEISYMALARKIREPIFLGPSMAESCPFFDSVLFYSTAIIAIIIITCQHDMQKLSCAMILIFGIQFRISV